MKKAFVLLVIVCSMFSQEKPKSSVFLELGGAGLLWSLNYDMFIGNDYIARVGYGNTSLDAVKFQNNTLTTEKLSITTIPIAFSYFSNGLEAGAVLTYVSFSDATVTVLGKDLTAAGIIGGIQAGYRYQPSDKGFLFRGGILAYLIGTSGVTFGLSGGYAF